MTREEIQDGETRTLEFKKELPQDSSKWIKTIVAFANGAGGKFIIGITNQLQVEGLSKDESIFSLCDKIADVISQKCSPQIMFDKDVQRMSTILDYLKTHDSITSDLTATLLAVEQKIANRLLTKAVSLKILAPHGANKNRTYSLKKDDE